MSPATTEPARAAAAEAPPQRDLLLRINGREQRLRVDLRTTLLDALREHLGLTGSKKGCDLGQCGARTVLVDGRRINASLTLAVMQEGREITTIEGLARGDGNSPLHGAADDAAAFADGRIFRTDDPSAGEGYREILERHRADRVEAEGKAQPGDEAQKLSMHAFGAFVR